MVLDLLHRIIYKTVYIPRRVMGHLVLYYDIDVAKLHCFVAFHS